MYNDVSVNQLLAKWYAFASEAGPSIITAQLLFTMIDEVRSLFDVLSDKAHSQFTRRVVNAYYGIEEAEEPDPVLTESEDA